MKAPSASHHLPKSLTGFSRGLAALSILGSLALGSSSALAADGTWNVDAGGSWTLSDGTPWLNGTVASGVDFTAFFNTVNITGNRTVTLAENLFIGNLAFGDATTASNDWILNSSAGLALTLQTTSGTPTITVDNRTTTINAVLAGTQGFTKAGSGVLAIAGNNTFTGGVTVNAGTLSVYSTNAIGNNDIFLASGAILDASNPVSSSTTISGNITGAGRILKTNSGSTLVLTGNNTFTGGTTISDGTIAVGTGLNNGIGTGTLTMNSGAIMSSDNNARTFNNALSFGSNSVRFGAAQGATTGLGDLTFTSTTGISIGGSKNWTVNNTTRVTFKNSWSGNSGWNITKQGTGTLVFDGNITGTTSVGIIVTAGTMILNGSKTATGAVTVNSGGTLGGNSPSMAGTFTLNAGGAISPGDGGIGTLTATNLTWNGETSGAFAQMKFELGSGSSDKLALGSGILTKGTGSIFAFDFLGTGIAGNTYTLLTFGSSTFSVGDFSYTNLGSGLTGSFALAADSLTFTVVPEPTTCALLGAGFMVVLFARRGRRSTTR